MSNPTETKLPKFGLVHVRHMSDGRFRVSQPGKLAMVLIQPSAELAVREFQQSAKVITSQATDAVLLATALPYTEGKIDINTYGWLK